MDSAESVNAADGDHFEAETKTTAMIVATQILIVDLVGQSNNHGHCPSSPKFLRQQGKSIVVLVVVVGVVAAAAGCCCWLVAGAGGWEAWLRLWLWLLNCF